MFGDAVRHRCAPLLLGFQRMPVGFHLLSGVRIDVREDVWVAPDQFFDDATSDVVNVPALLPSLLSNACMEDNLQQKIPEFLAQAGVIAAFDRFDGLVGLLDEVLDETLVRLACIPRAATR